MPILYDKQGKPAKVPEEKLQEALASGYTFPKGKPVIMKGPAGEVLEGPAEEVSEMLNRGYSLESGAEAEERELQVEY